MKIGKFVRGAVAGAILAALIAAPASADAGITIDPETGRFVSGGGNFFVGPSVAGNYVTVDFECDAVAGPDASQTRILPSSDDGCVLYAGDVAVGYASGQSVTGAAAVANGTAQVPLLQAGHFRLCWNVSATYLLNEGRQLFNAGCGF
jgi:hypothetical protein